MVKLCVHIMYIGSYDEWYTCGYLGGVLWIIVLRK